MSEDENFDLEATCRELVREKSRLQCEVRTLRDELDETRLKLEEKTAQCESFGRKMDSINRSLPQTTSALQDECKDYSHVTLDCRIQAAEARKAVLENEVDILLGGKKDLIREMDEMKRKHEGQVMQLTNLIQTNEQLFSQERNEFEIKYKEIKATVDAQREYIAELEATICLKEEENVAWIAQIHGQVKHFMTDALEAITVVEEQRSDTVNKKNQITEELTKLQVQFDSLKERIKSYRRKIVAICDKALCLLNVNSSPDFLDEPDWERLFIHHEKASLETLQSPPGATSKDSNADTEMGNLAEKDFMKQFLQSIYTAKEMHKNQQLQLEGRIQDLQNMIQIEKAKQTSEIEGLQTKCKMYNRLIRKLRSRIPSSMNSFVAITESSPASKIVVNSDGEQHAKDDNHLNSAKEDSSNPNFRILKKKHEYFEQILRDLDDCDSSDEINK